MFDPINGPTNQYEGPATGLTTEKGDSWHTAVKKINDGFKAIFSTIDAPVDVVDAEARKEIADLRETVAKMQITIDRMAIAAVTAAPTPPVQTPPAEAAATASAATNG